MATKKNETEANPFGEVDWTGADEMVTAESLKDGESASGFYLGTAVTVLPMGPAQIHHLRGFEGTRRAIIGSSLLDSMLAGVKLGKAVHLTRIGRMDGKRVVNYGVKVHPTLQSNDAADFIGKPGN